MRLNLYKNYYSFGSYTIYGEWKYIYDEGFKEFKPEMLMNNDESYLYDLVKRSVGNFILIDKNKDDYSIFTSLSSSGFYYSKSRSLISNDEEDIIRNSINDNNRDQLNEYISNHHSVRRSLFSQLIDDYEFIPSATHIKVNEGGISLRKLILLTYTEFNDEIKNLSFSDLFHKSYDTNSILAFSGGIDSIYLSCLFPNRIHNIYKDYGKEDELKSVNYFSKKFKKVSVLDWKLDAKKEKITDNIGLKSIKLHHIHSEKTLEVYISNMIEWGGYNKNIISGQNADTLLHGDHFSPNSRIYGLRRFVKLLLSTHRRFLFSKYYFNTLSKNSFLDRIFKIYAVPEEHAHDVSNFLPERYNQINLFKEDYLEALKAFERTYIYKVMRYYKTISNFNMQFYLREIAEKNKYHLPYTDSPVALKLLDEVNGFEYIISPKRKLVRSINKYFLYWKYIKISQNKSLLNFNLLDRLKFTGKKNLSDNKKNLLIRKRYFNEI